MISIPAIPALQAFIVRYHKGSANQFAKVHRLDQSEVSRVLRGERSRFSVVWVYRIQVATKGAVKWTMWIPQ